MGQFKVKHWIDFGSDNNGKELWLGFRDGSQ